METLTDAAITNSPELAILEEKVNLINQRLELAGERIDYSQDRQWTSYITADPIRLIQNIFGGGDIQRDRIAIADLEIKAADLEAAKAELEFRKGNIKVELEEEILSLLLAYESNSRYCRLTESQLEIFNQQYEIYRIKYRFGQGNTNELLNFNQRKDTLEIEISNLSSEINGIIRELQGLTNYEQPN